nr:Uncharacterised protein [Raoultella sp. NCTC 9187]
MIGCHPKFNTPATAQCKSCKVIVFTIIVSHNRLFILDVGEPLFLAVLSRGLKHKTLEIYVFSF